MLIVDFEVRNGDVECLVLVCGNLFEELLDCSKDNAGVFRRPCNRMSLKKSVGTINEALKTTFPHPVAPYAKTVALNPSITPSINGLVVASNTCCCVASSLNTRSKAYRTSFRLFFVPYVFVCLSFGSTGSAMRKQKIKKRSSIMCRFQ